MRITWKTPSKEWGQKGSQSREWEHKRDPKRWVRQGKALIDNKQGDKTASVQQKHEDIERVKSFPSKLEKLTSTSFSNILVSFYFLLVLML